MKSNNIFFSVILSNYNGQKYLEEAIESILRQTYTNFELILIDDASTDNSKDVLKKYESHQNITVKYLEKNSGQSGGFNTGVSLSKGDWVAFMDSDDTWYSNKLEEISKKIIEFPDAAFIQHNLEILRGEQKTSIPYRKYLIEGDLWSKFSKNSQLLTFIPTAGLTFNKKVLEKVLPIPSQFRVCADGYLTRTCMLYGDVVSIQNSLGEYRIHSQNNTFANSSYSVPKYLMSTLLPSLEKYYHSNGFIYDFSKLKYYSNIENELFENALKLGLRNFGKAFLKAFLAKTLSKYNLLKFVPSFFIPMKIMQIANAEKIVQLNKAHYLKRAFIIGSGPSLTITDLGRLKNEVTFGCNKIFLAYKDIDWRPTYYSVTDILVAQNNKDQIRGVKSKKIFSESVASEFNNDKDIVWIKNLPPIKAANGEREFLISDDMLVGAYGGFTVIYLQIQLAIYMGIKEIYLLGIDFSFDVSAKSGEVCKHGEVLINENEQNHFHPDYRKKGESWTMPRLDMHKKAFDAAKLYADKNGVKIYNASRKTELDSFPVVNFDSLF